MGKEALPIKETDLIQRCQHGDHSAYRELYDLYAAATLRTAYLIVHDKALAEDAVQEAFVRVFKGIRFVDLRRPFAPWFLRIVVNEAIHCAEWNRRGGQPGEVPEQLALSDTAAEAGKADLRRQLGECLAELPATMRALVALKYYRDLSDPEIADLMDCPVGTVKSRLARARVLLRDLCRSRGLDLILEGS